MLRKTPFGNIMLESELLLMLLSETLRQYILLLIKGYFFLLFELCFLCIYFCYFGRKEYRGSVSVLQKTFWPREQIKLFALITITLSSMYTHFITPKKKSARKTLWKKVKLLILSNFTFFLHVFYAICTLTHCQMTKF